MLFLPAVSRSAAAQVRGDSAASAAVERMLAALGGREVWALSRTLVLEYHGWVVTPRAAADTEVAWRDLREPNQRIEHRAGGAWRASAFTPRGGWRHRGGVVQPMSELAHRTALSFWPRDFYTLLRRFAVNDPDLFVTMLPPIRVVVSSVAQGELGWFEIASDGAIVRWGTLDEGEALEYVYGPMQSFGRVRFPAWGASLDGRWRFAYGRVELSADPVPDSLLVQPAR
jgi:hypothetical protein